EDDATQTAVELDQFTALDAAEAIDARDAIAHLQYGAYFLQIGLRPETGKFLFEDRRYFGWFYFCHDLLDLGYVRILGEFAPQVLQAARYTSIVLIVADADHQSTDQIGIHRLRDLDALPWMVLFSQF